ncbi:pyridoxal phosphate-dependent aminotransferase [Streptomyces sp. NPDC048258]|uniref:pyridoxal phosphate-dependent aminotransferase n=1 Tax=Streptomyces sp. NPDC048258 TaxID=3365527 RepID=UPI00371F019B
MSTAPHEVVDLASGQIVEPLPESAREALAKAAAADRVVAYAAPYGQPELRAAVADHYAERTGTTVDPELITVTAGARHGLFAAFDAVARGGEVLVPQPHWSHYPSVIRRAGAEPVAVPGDRDHGLLVGPAELERAYTDRTRAVLVNSPVNPSGAYYDRARMRSLRAWAAERDVRLIVDDIYWAYADFVDREVRASAHEIVVGGASKVYALAGLRVGWVWAAPQFCAAVRDCVEYTTGPVSTLSQAAAAAVLRERDALGVRTAALARQRATAVEAMTGIPLLRPVAPAGGIYLCLDATEALARRAGGARDDQELCAVLAAGAGVRLRAGSTFGMPGHLRLCVAEQPEALFESARRLTGFLADLT